MGRVSVRLDVDSADVRSYRGSTSIPDDVRLCLILEDEPTSARLARAAIDEIDAFSISASTLADATRALDEWPIDLAVVDLGLPDGNGLDFVQELRSICSCPIVVYTGSADRETVAAAVAAGANDYRLKPVDVRDLSTRVRSLMARIPSPWESWSETAARTSMSRAQHDAAVEAYAADLVDLAERHEAGGPVEEGALDEMLARAERLGHRSLAMALERERARPSKQGVSGRLRRAARSAELLLKGRHQGAGPLPLRRTAGAAGD
jgi:DNA-binding response OmpR family regulator